MKIWEHRLYEREEATLFSEAYPIGNGKLGAMVYGGTGGMRFGLNHDELWAGYSVENSYKEYDKESFKKVEQLALEGKYLEAEKLYTEKFARHDGGAYLTLGDVYIKMPEGDVSEYIRELNLRDSLASVRYKLSGKKVEVRTFASYPKGVLIINVKTEQKCDYELLFDIEMTNAAVVKGGRVSFFGQCPKLCQRQLDRGDRYFDLEEREGIRFSAVFEAKSDGDVSASEEKLMISGATDTTFFFTCETSYKEGSENGESEYKELAQKYIDGAVKYGFEELYREHTEDVHNLYDRVDFSLETPYSFDAPTHERIQSFFTDKPDYSLIVTEYNLGRYLLIAGSREGSRAANLQGIWNEEMNAPWCSNFTTNINTEMNYWPCVHAGLFELIEPLESLCRVLTEKGKVAAENIYGYKGACASHNADIFGYCAPAAGQARWSFFPVSLGWLLREIYNKYLYTLDRDYLESVYGMIYSAAEYMIDALKDDGEYLFITPGASAENVYYLGDKQAAFARSSTLFMSIVRETVSNFIEASETLGKSSDLLTRAKAAFPRLLPLRITDDGRIEEWYFGGKSVAPKEVEVHHRHISHLYDLYPSNVINKKNKPLFDAARETLRVRGDEATGWSLGWKINCYARLHDSEGVMRLIRMFLRPVEPDRVKTMSGGGVYPNLLCAHPPFQIDGNFGFAAAIPEMLISDDGEELNPLHALPHELANGHFKGLHIKGGRVVDMEWKDGKITEFNVYKK